MRRTLEALVLVALVSAGCTHKAGSEVPWSPPPKQVLDTDDPTVIVGRLWVAPNPIPIHPHEDGTDMVSINVGSLGGERVVIESMSIVGPVDLRCGAMDDIALSSLPFSEHSCCWYDGCGGGGIWGSWLDYRPTEGDRDAQSWLVVHTSDPTSPTLRVPIVFDDEGRYALPPMTPGYDIRDWDHVWARPNPVRIRALEAGESTSVDICLDSENTPAVTDVSVWGEGLTLVGVFDGDGSPCTIPTSPDGPYPRSLTVGYESSGSGDVDGVVMVTYVNTYGDAFTQGFPVLVR